MCVFYAGPQQIASQEPRKARSFSPPLAGTTAGTTPALPRARLDRRLWGALIALPFGRYRGDGVDHHAGSSRPAIGCDTSRGAPDLNVISLTTCSATTLGCGLHRHFASEHPQVVTGLAGVETVIPGLARLPFVFVHQRDNSFLWHSLFNQLSDLPEMRIEARGGDYLFWSLPGSGT
jgi:hypothetical protein